jgi:stage II sporulation protein D
MKRFKAVVSVLLCISLIFIPVLQSKAQNQLPEYLRVGLYFTDPAAHINTAVSSFTISAAKGISIGFSTELAAQVPFFGLYSDSSSNNHTIKKDADYHIKIGENYEDFTNADAAAKAISQLGINAYVAYADCWQVWTGPYSTQQAAQDEISANLINKLGTDLLTVIAPATSRIVVLNSQNQISCAFESSEAYFRIKAAEDNNPPVLRVNGKPYRGLIEVRRLTGSDMTVINIVSIAEYLYGVVPAEIGASSHPEALKAQAVAAKMYALNSIGKHKKTEFDVCATTNCQVYKGYDTEVASCNQAIAEVANSVITYNSQPAKHIYYFASSGGRTEDPINVWGSSHDYLKSVEDKYEPIYNWTKTFSASEIQARVPQVGRVLGVDVTRRADSGRVTQLAVRGDKSSTPAFYSLERCRTVFGLNSQMYTITTDADINITNGSKDKMTQLGGLIVTGSGKTKSIKSATSQYTVLGAGGVSKTYPATPESFTFAGKGWGHAVGMSQEGARAMAKAGIKYNEIIEHYFPGTKVVSG